MPEVPEWVEKLKQLKGVTKILQVNLNLKYSDKYQRRYYYALLKIIGGLLYKAHNQSAKLHHCGDEDILQKKIIRKVITG